MAPHGDFEAGELSARVTALENQFNRSDAKLDEIRGVIMQTRMAVARLEDRETPCPKHMETMQQHARAIAKLQQTQAIHKWIFAAVGACLAAVAAPMIEWIKK